MEEILNYFYTNEVRTAETIQEEKELLKSLAQ